ncbi:SRPBCC family protein [Micromonospora parva]|uniref:SRPBCC family protein n=1 Tax=Micromonospora parva TaxID=1464048 RepID=UPI0037ADB687
MKGTMLQRPGRWLTWGATTGEVAATLPGDELLADPDIVSTRAVTIDAPPKAVWPWLVQMGSGRGGAYTYDWIENLFGLDMHSADEILPQFQHLAIGDELPLGKSGPAMRVEVLDPERTLVFRSADGAWVWAFHLRPDRTGTRLISRNRIVLAGRPRPARIAYRLVMEPGSLVMERRMLLGIKQRAEGPS